MPKKNKKDQHQYIKDNIYRDLLEMESEFGDIILVVIPPIGDEKTFSSMVDAVEFIKVGGGTIQVIKEETNVLIYEAIVEVDYPENNKDSD
jgi:hypothetical protein